jgi:selenide,water dikinase
LDFFTPHVDDPYMFGQIVAANSLSDVYAMGAKPLTAQNILCYTKEGDEETLRQMLKGCQDKMKEAGCLLTGGHSIYDDSVKLGLSVLGQTHPDKIWRNDTPQLGDKIILTKKLGTSIISIATNVYDVSQETLDEMYAQMTMLNKYAYQVGLNYKINACTDITGFGLAGHLFEMIKSSDFSATIDTNNLNYIDDALYYAKNYVFTSSGQINRNFFSKFIESDGIENAMMEVIYDAQTSGGLLFSVNATDAEAMLSELNEKGIPASIIGEVTEKKDKKIIIR